MRQILECVKALFTIDKTNEEGEKESKPQKWFINPRRACAEGLRYYVCMSVHSAHYLRRLYSKQIALSSITLRTKEF